MIVLVTMSIKKLILCMCRIKKEKHSHNTNVIIKIKIKPKVISQRNYEFEQCSTRRVKNNRAPDLYSLCNRCLVISTVLNQIPANIHSNYENPWGYQTGMLFSTLNISFILILSFFVKIWSFSRGKRDHRLPKTQRFRRRKGGPWPSIRTHNRVQKNKNKWHRH